jgi:hypothetical protein
MLTPKYQRTELLLHHPTQSDRLQKDKTKSSLSSMHKNVAFLCPASLFSQPQTYSTSCTVGRSDAQRSEEHEIKHTHTHRNTHTHTHTQKHTCTRAHTHKHTCTHTHKHTCTHTRTHAHTRARTNTHAHARMHAHKHTCTCTHTHTHTHTINYGLWKRDFTVRRNV